MVLLDRVSGADAGQFKITDILGFTVSYIHLKVKRKEGSSGFFKKNKHLMVSMITFLKGTLHSKLKFHPFSTDTAVGRSSLDIL